MPARMNTCARLARRPGGGSSGLLSWAAVRAAASNAGLSAAGGGATAALRPDGGAAGAAGAGAPRVNCIPHRGQLSTTPTGTCDGSNTYGHVGFGHFSMLLIANPAPCGRRAYLQCTVCWGFRGKRFVSAPPRSPTSSSSSSSSSGSSSISSSGSAAFGSATRMAVSPASSASSSGSTAFARQPRHSDTSGSGSPYARLRTTAFKSEPEATRFAASRLRPAKSFEHHA